MPPFTVNKYSWSDNKIFSIKDIYSFERIVLNARMLHQQKLHGKNN